MTLSTFSKITGATLFIGGAILGTVGLFVPFNVADGSQAEAFVRFTLQLAGVGGMLAGFPLVMAR